MAEEKKKQGYGLGPPKPEDEPSAEILGSGYAKETAEIMKKRKKLHEEVMKDLEKE